MVFFDFVKGKKMRRKIPPHDRLQLLLTERLAVGALVHGRVCLVSAHQNLVQGAVVLAVAVISAGLDGAFDALVCIAVHILFLLLIWYAISMTRKFCDNLGKSFLLIAIFPVLWYGVKEIHRAQRPCR